MNNVSNCSEHLNGVVACRGVSPIQMHFNYIEGTATDPNRFRPADKSIKVAILE